jgi:hypothetical protein
MATNFLESVPRVEPPARGVGFEDIEFQECSRIQRGVHQPPTDASPPVLGVNEDPAHLVAQSRQESDEESVNLGDRRLSPGKELHDDLLPRPMTAHRELRRSGEWKRRPVDG